MSHYIHVLISSAKTLKPIGQAHQHAQVAPLPQGLALLPITKAFSAEVTQIDTSSTKQSFGQFESLTCALAELAINLSTTTPVIYAETEYFGGQGAQSAIVWKNGEIVLGPLTTQNIDKGQRGTFTTSLADGAINQALRCIGIDRLDQIDEFDAIGLSKYRSDEDWINAANAQQ